MAAPTPWDWRCKFNTPHFTFDDQLRPTLAPQSSCYADVVFQPVASGRSATRSRCAATPLAARTR
jgi:hypothetical protein